MIIDTHCHLPNVTKGEALKTLLTNAKNAGVNYLINIGTDIKSNQQVIETSTTYDNIFCSVGIYPNNEKSKTLPELSLHLNQMLQNFEHKKVVAIGECGIDNTEWEQQRPLLEQQELFEMQVSLCADKNLTLIIHNRNGDKEIIEILNKYKDFNYNIVAHCFASNLQTAKQLVNLNSYLSFSGMITYENKQELLEVVKYCPLDKILVETDAPYLTPQNFKTTNKTNEPAFIIETLQKIADIKGISYDLICKHTYENAINAFNLKRYNISA